MTERSPYSTKPRPKLNLWPILNSPIIITIFGSVIIGSFVTLRDSWQACLRDARETAETIDDTRLEFRFRAGDFFTVAAGGTFTFPDQDPISRGERYSLLKYKDVHIRQLLHTFRNAKRRTVYIGMNGEVISVFPIDSVMDIFAIVRTVEPLVSAGQALRRAEAAGNSAEIQRAREEVGHRLRDAFDWYNRAEMEQSRLQFRSNCGVRSTIARWISGTPGIVGTWQEVQRTDFGR